MYYTSVGSLPKNQQKIYRQSNYYHKIKHFFRFFLRSWFLQIIELHFNKKFIKNQQNIVPSLENLSQRTPLVRSIVTSAVGIIFTSSFIRNTDFWAFCFIPDS